MVTDISSGSFDSAPFSHFSTGFTRRSAQDDKWERDRSNKKRALRKQGRCSGLLTGWGSRPSSHSAESDGGKAAAWASARVSREHSLTQYVVVCNFGMLTAPSTSIGVSPVVSNERKTSQV